MSAPLIHLTPTAQAKLRDLLSLKSTPLAFRIYVTGGGCTGMQYNFKFDPATPEDVICNVDGVTLAIDPFSVMYLSGATVDYKVSIKGASFVVQNPNAASTCSCGSSFSVAGMD